MDQSVWERVQAIFLETAALPEGERQNFLERACGGDERMLSEVSAMLEAERRGSSLLDRGLPDVAYQMVGGSHESFSFREFGPYRLKKILGEGGMGVVWLAEREDTGSLVAIKFLLHANLSPARRERFSREIRTLAKLKHPYIARLYDAGTLADGTPWFVMEYVDGVPFAEYCRQLSSVEEQLRLFRKVCEAVQSAHGQAIIHRDLKPSNILVQKDGTPRLLDFGIARELQGLDETSERTQPGLRFLSPDYAAPEWAREGTIGICTDVYSLGVILFEMLAGRLPMAGDRPDRVSSPPGRFGLSKTAWNDLDVLCLKGRHPDPRERYQSVEALIRDIDHFLESEPLEGRPQSLRYRTRKFLIRNRRAVAATSLAAIAVFGLVAFFAWRLASARTAALAEAARTQRVEQFMENLFQGGDKDAGPADDLRVVTLLDRGLQQARSLGSDPMVQAELYETLGTIYRKLGKLNQADDALRIALERRQSMKPPDAAAVASSLLALALLRSDQARFPDAERLVRESLAIEELQLPPSHPAIPRAMAALGRILEERGEYESALQVLNQALRRQTAITGTGADLADTLELLADAHFYLSHYGDSESFSRQALQILERVHGRVHPSVALVFLNLGHIQIQVGRYPEAEQYFRQALSIDQAWYGKDHPETARAEGYVSQSLNWEGKYGESQNLLQHALAATEQAYGTNHPRVALILSDLGVVATQLGKLDDAETDFARMLEIYRSAYGNQHLYTAQALVNLGSVYQNEKQYVRAEKLFREALQIYAGIVPAGHVNTAVAEVKLGRALLSQKRYREAEAQTLGGYNILVKQASPSLNYLQAARSDLRKIYEGLGEPAKAATFQEAAAAQVRK